MAPTNYSNSHSAIAHQGPNSGTVIQNLHNVQNVHNVHNVHNIHAEYLKSDFPPTADDAAFDSNAEEHNAQCHPDTRTELLGQIKEWANDSQAESIFWLNGMAGTGKSTISRTVAQSFKDQNLLGASFFFKRGEGDRGKATLFFPPLPASFLLVAFTTIWRLRSSSTLSTSAAETTMVFITSRPELPIRLGFNAVQGKYQDMALHQIPELVVERDISTFVRHELANIRDQHNSLPPNRKLPLDWPGENVIHTLTQMAIPLFIFAATACRFIGDEGRSNPDKRLKHVLKYQTETHDSRLDKLDATYLPVLSQLTFGRNDRDQAEFLTEFRDVVGPIVLLAQPLSTRSLAELLNIANDDIEDQLMSLHSVLDIPSQIDAPVRLFHLSFREFLVDPTKRTTKDFWIDETKYHKTLADRCIQLLRQHLRRDICGLQLPGKLRSEVDQRTIDAALPPEVQYACQYWVHHLKESKGSKRDGGPVYSFLRDGDPVHSFLTSHLLNWLEALSLLGRVSESVGMVDDLVALSPADAIEISGFFHDIRRFVQSSRSIIDMAPLQVYASALVFSPAGSITRGLFKQEERRWITTGPVVEDDWNACTQTLEGHSSSVNSVAFSPDSKLVASGSDDKTVKIWDAATGTCTQTLEGHSGSHHTSNLITSWSGDEEHLPHQNYGIGSDGRWIVRGSENWLWLPPGCRPGCSAGAASTIAIGCTSGRVLIMMLPADM